MFIDYEEITRELANNQKKLKFMSQTLSRILWDMKDYLNLPESTIDMKLGVYESYTEDIFAVSDIICDCIQEYDQKIKDIQKEFERRCDYE